MGNNPAPEGGRVVPLAKCKAMPTGNAANWSLEAFLHAPDAMAVWDESHCLVHCNAAYRALRAGLDDRLTPGVRFDDLALALAPAGREPLSEDVGAEGWSANRLTPDQPAAEAWTAGGRRLRRTVTATPAGFLIESLIDVTDEYRRELAHREGHARLNAIMAALPDLLVQVDAEGRYRAAWNHGAPVAGTDRAVPADALVGLRLDETFVQPLAAQLMAHLSAVRETGSLQMLEYEVDTPAGQRHFEARSVPMDADNTISIVRDVTVEKLREETLRRHLDELEAAEAQLRDQAGQLRALAAQFKAAQIRAEEASATKSAFLANMSHELRTPLNAVIGFAELIKDEMLGMIGNERYIQYARDIHESGTLLLSLINDILDLSKIEAGGLAIEPGAVDVRRAVSSCLRLVSGRAEQANLRLTADVPDGCPPAHADERALKQILANLLSNAIKFTPSGGTVHLSFEPLPDGSLRIAVADSGIGIKEQDLGSIFEPFRQVHTEHPHQPRYPGTGLGLPLVKSLVELHGGRVGVESRPGEGTTVSLVLPGRPNGMAG